MIGDPKGNSVITHTTKEEHVEDETRTEDADVEGHKKHFASEESEGPIDPEKKADNDEPDVEGHKMSTKHDV